MLHIAEMQGNTLVHSNAVEMHLYNTFENSEKYGRMHSLHMCYHN